MPYDVDVEVRVVNQEDLDIVLKLARGARALRKIVAQVEERGALQRGRLAKALTVREMHALWSTARMLAALDVPRLRVVKAPGRPRR